MFDDSPGPALALASCDVRSSLISRGGRDVGSTVSSDKASGTIPPLLLPVALSFLGPAFSDAKLLAYGHAFEQALAVRRLPVTTPPLPGERFE